MFRITFCKVYLCSQTIGPDVIWTTNHSAKYFAKLAVLQARNDISVISFGIDITQCRLDTQTLRPFTVS